MVRMIGATAAKGIASLLTSRMRIWDPDAARRADLARQMEDLLDQVWACERWWATERRIDAAVASMREP